MRIAEISTLYRSVPSEGEGAIESLVSSVTEGLVKRGHEVTLFATADSRTKAILRSPVRTSYTYDSNKWDWQLYESYQAREAFQSWKDFDLIHCHSYHFGLLFCDFIPIPSLHTIHIEPGPDYLFLARRTRNRHLQFCSRYQSRHFTSIPGIHVIPHGVNLEQFHVSQNDQRENYMAYLGRFLPDKGPLQAIQLARRTGIPLKMAGPTNDYFNEVVKPEIDGRLIEFIGEARDRQKADFLSKARALIYPVQRGEPFGLVLIEAMASGLPIVALNKGAAPEIVRHGATGWLGESERDLIVGLERVDQMDRLSIRNYVKENFSDECMINRIEKLMIDILGGSLT